MHEDSNRTAFCSSCLFGSICPFITSYYSALLEASLLASLQPKRITVIVIVTSLVSTAGSILSITSFCKVSARKMGSGIDRLWSSIVGQLSILPSTIRLLLIFSQKSTEPIGCSDLDHLISVLPCVYYCVTARIVISILILYHFLIALLIIIIHTQHSHRTYRKLRAYTGERRKREDEHKGSSNTWEKEVRYLVSHWEGRKEKRR